VREPRAEAREAGDECDYSGDGEGDGCE
jgi:hypothetical protein